MNDPNPQPERRPHPLERPPEPPRTQQPTERMMIDMQRTAPYLSYVLIAINGIIFSLSVFAPESYFSLVMWGANSGSGVLGNGEYYRLFTAMFLHANFAHIFFNMYALNVLGQSVEQFYGRWRFLAVYFLGGLTGSVASAWLNDPDIIGVGASGAVFALIGAQFAFTYRYRHELGEMGRGALRHYASILAINILIGIAVPQIDNTAHMGGLIGGVALGWMLAPLVTARESLTMTRDTVRVVSIRPDSSNTNLAALYALGLVGAVLLLSVGF